MILTHKKLSNVLRQKEGIRLTRQQKKNKVIEWCSFYRQNISTFITDYLEIPLYPFQEMMSNTMNENDISDIFCSRGSSKSFIVGCFAISYALLYPNSNIAITSLTLNQSNNIIKEKIDKELSDINTGISPVLRQLRKDEYIKFGQNRNTGSLIVELKNGSKIFAVVCDESGRGSRTQVNITDEATIVKKKNYQEIVEPMLTQRSVKFDRAKYGIVEEPKQIFLSSTRSKTNWMFRHLKKTVEGHYKDKRIKYGFFSVDIFTAVASGIQTVNQYLSRKRNTDELSFLQEYLNIWIGSSEDSFYKLEQFEVNQVLDTAYHQSTVDDILSGVENEYKFHDNDIRIVTSDIALANGEENDNSTIICSKVDLNTNKHLVESIEINHGLNTLKQTILMKRAFYQYKAKYYVLDVKGVGQGIFDLLTIPTCDDELGITYPAWGVCDDKELQLSSDSVLEDKKQRTLSTDVEEVIIPFAGTSELNSQMHYNLRKCLIDRSIQFLKDDRDMQPIMEDKDPSFILKSPEEKARLLNPYMQTRLMINEAISLEKVVNDNMTIKLKEKSRSDTKDRLMSISMANLLATKIINKYIKNENEEDFDIDDFSEIYNY